MYKGIIFSILCMPLISFGMDRDITDQGFNDFDMMLSVEQDLFALEQRTLPDTQGSNDPDLQAAVLSLFTDDDSLASSQSNAVNTQLHFPDLQSAESGVLYCDEILGNDADKEDTQLSALYDDSTPQHMQARYDAINMQGLNDAELQAIILNFTIDNPSAQSQSNVNRQELHFPDLQLAESGTYDAVLDDEDSLALREIQKRYEENRKKCPIEICSRIFKSALGTTNHVASQYNICLLCNPPLSYEDRAGIEDHFMQEHPGQTFTHNIKREACKKCGKMMNSTWLERHAAKCKVRKYAYTQSKLEKLKKRYAENKKQCPICLQLFKGIESTVSHVAAKHSICLRCDPPLDSVNRVNIKQHFKQQHPSDNYAAHNEKTICEQCGKEMLKNSMNQHLMTGSCKQKMISVAAATTSDKH